MILLILSFIAGILTVLAPCTLPLLPVIIGSSVSGESDRKKAVIITISLAVSIILFTYILKVSTLFISIPEEVWSIISGVIIMFFGFTSLFPDLWEDIRFISELNVSSNRMLSAGYKKKSIWGDVIIGASLGPVFSSCSPTYFVVLASVLPKSFLLGSIDLLVYAVGLSGTLLLIAFLGQKLVTKLGWVSDTHGLFRRTLGVIFIILGLGIVFGLDKQVEANILSSGFFDVTTVEQSLLKLNDNSLSSSQGTTTSGVASTTPIIKSSGPKAPEIVDPSGFINTGGQPITIGQFKGKKVILLDIWTYSCINCERTLPYVESWYEKYKDEGLVFIGLHTPEFAFEKVQSNVEAAVKRLGLTYPIVMDNDYATWNAYGNQYWPRKYLINANGEIIYDHIGEGNYDETEQAIVKALSELDGKQVQISTTTPVGVIPMDPNKVQSPETYFGSNRNEYLANGIQSTSGQQNLTLPTTFDSNALYLEGLWNFSPEYATSNSPAKIVFKYNAKNVYMVGSSDAGVTVTVMKDGVKEKTLFIKGDELYTLIEGSDYGEHTLEVDIPSGGLDAFTLTFG